MAYVGLGLLVYNVVVLLVYGLDKFKARRAMWRVSEKRLLLLAALGGAPGALLGMYLFRHKTQKLAFAVGIPALFIAQAVLAGWLKTQGYW